MNLSPDIPDDIEALKTALIAARTHAVHVETELATARARVSDDQALIAHLKLVIAKLNRERFGPRAERTARLINQFELQLEELESSATEDELAAEKAVGRTTNVAAFTRKRPARKPFPAHLPGRIGVGPQPGLTTPLTEVVTTRARAGRSLSTSAGFTITVRWPHQADADQTCGPIPLRKPVTSVRLLAKRS